MWVNNFRSQTLRLTASLLAYPNGGVCGAREEQTFPRFDSQNVVTVTGQHLGTMVVFDLGRSELFLGVFFLCDLLGKQRLSFFLVLIAQIVQIPFLVGRDFFLKNS